MGSSRPHRTAVPTVAARDGTVTETLPGTGTLSEHDAAVLELADRHLLGDAFTEARTELGYTNDTAFHWKLNWLLDDPHTAAATPALVNRLRRWRTDHCATRRH